MVFLPALYNKLQCVADAITRVPATELKVEHSRGKEQRRTQACRPFLWQGSNP